MKTAVLTSVRNDSVFLDRWLDYYGSLFGPECLYVILDGFDQPVPASARASNILRVPFVPSNRSTADRRRARLISDVARGLHRLYDVVIALDVDEFLVADPAWYSDLGALIRSAHSVGCTRTMSGLGLDVVHHAKREWPIQPGRPVLGQRRYAHITTRYTKPAISFSPVTWGSGFHRVKGRNFHIQPHLYLFHFGLMDLEHALCRGEDVDRLAGGWGNHIKRRSEAFGIVANGSALDFDEATRDARRIQTWMRSPFALNKPMMIGAPRVVRISERFDGIV